MELLNNSYGFLFLILLPLVAFLYASVGHGGASGYLALMALFSFEPKFMKPAALLLNTFVSLYAFYYFYKEGHFNKKLFLMFGIGSIPFAYLGGTFEIDTKIYKIILGIFLLIAIFKILVSKSANTQQTNEINWLKGGIIGSGIGFFSGLIGIGGGIILSPLILLFKWGNFKEAAAVSALFIWVNSIAGLGGQLYKEPNILTQESFIMAGIASIGGILGAKYGSGLKNIKTLNYLLAIVLFIATIKLFTT